MRLRQKTDFFVYVVVVFFGILISAVSSQSSGRALIVSSISSFVKLHESFKNGSQSYTGAYSLKISL